MQEGTSVVTSYLLQSPVLPSISSAYLCKLFCCQSILHSLSYPLHEKTTPDCYMRIRGGESHLQAGIVQDAVFWHFQSPWIILQVACGCSFTPSVMFLGVSVCPVTKTHKLRGFWILKASSPKFDVEELLLLPMETSTIVPSFGSLSYFSAWTNQIAALFRVMPAGTTRDWITIVNSIGDTFLLSSLWDEHWVKQFLRGQVDPIYRWKPISSAWVPSAGMHGKNAV